MITYVPRLSKPEQGNKYYIRKADGGFSDAIVGKPTDPDCNVLANCVGYAYGRFNEIGEYGSCKYLAPVNPCDFFKYKGDCETGSVPRLGACMVWEKHVAIVEQIVSATEVVTSESVYNGAAFCLQKRKKGSDGNWGQPYKFTGFIYNPAVPEIKVGDKVDFIGGKHYATQNGLIGFNATAGKAEITKIKPGAKHPYHLVRIKGEGSNVWGWVNKDTFSVLGNIPQVGDYVNFFGGPYYDWQNAETGKIGKAGKCQITKIYTDGSRHPYHLVRVEGQGSDVWGFVDEGTFEVVK